MVVRRGKAEDLRVAKLINQLRNSTMPKWVWMVIAALVLASTAPAQGQPSLSKTINVGTKVKGSFKFTTGPSEGATGSWELTVLERSGRRFKALYRAEWMPPSDGPKMVCEVEGEVDGDKLEFAVRTDKAQGKATVVEVSGGVMKLRYEGGGGRVAELVAKLPSDDPFAEGAVWVGDFKVAQKGTAVLKWALTITERSGTKFRGDILVKNRDMEVETIRVAGTATDKARGAIVCQTERKGLAQVRLTGKLENGEAVLIFSGINDLGVRGAGVATLKPKN